MTPAEALALQHEWVASDSLRKHMLAVAACLRAYANKDGQDPELYEVVGLLHDFDYERHPTADEHPFVGVEELRRRGVDEVICRAILSHATYSGVPRESHLERALFACDELAGFVTAVALMRPEKLTNMSASSVRKKMKAKAFAANVSREDIVQGATEMGVDLNEHIEFCIAALQARAAELGLV
ncbi:MAG: HD domain-containing protein [Armatimonadetes bacterium]|nr:HD domain-containing protein [Armatimonadota bacterium]